MRPYDVTKHKDLLALQRDNFPADHDVWSILVGVDHVSLHQPDGGFVSIPTEQWRNIVQWYMTDQAELAKKKPA